MNINKKLTFGDYKDSCILVCVLVGDPGLLPGVFVVLDVHLVGVEGKSLHLREGEEVASLLLFGLLPI